MDLAAPEIAVPAAFANRFIARDTLERLELCLAIAAVRASTRGSSDMIASVMSSGNISTTGGSARATAGGSERESAAANDERWVRGDDVNDLEPRERLRSSFSSATGLSCCAAGRIRRLRIDPAGERDSLA